LGIHTRPAGEHADKIDQKVAEFAFENFFMPAPTE
jgi:hypothetical protein